MGFFMWLAKRKVRGIVKAMRKHYDQGRAMHPDRDLPSLCRDVIGSRYQTMKPTEEENEVIQQGIKSVADLYDAVVLVALAEANMPPDDTDLFCAVVQATVFEVAKTEGVANPEEHPDTLRKAAGLIKRFAAIKL